MAHLSKDSRIDRTVAVKASFFSTDLKGLNDTLVERMLALEVDWKEYQYYLRGLESLLHTNQVGLDLNEVEVPVCLQDVAPSVEPPKKKATAAGSKKKSPTKPRKTKGSSSTSPKTAA